MMLRASSQTMLCLSAQMKKSTSYELDFCIEATKKMFFAFLNKVSNSNEAYA